MRGEDNVVGRMFGCWASDGMVGDYYESVQSLYGLSIMGERYVYAVLTNRIATQIGARYCGNEVGSSGSCK